MWKLKKDKEEIPEKKDYGKSPREEELEMELQEIKTKLNKEKVPEKREEPETISKQEIIDIIEGNLNRINQLFELLRRVP